MSTFMASSMTVQPRVSSPALGRAAPRFRVSLTQALRFAPAQSTQRKAFRVMANEKQGKGGEEGGRKFDDSVFGKMGKSPNFTLLSAAIMKAGLEPTLVGKGPFTVFAPNDDAFFQAAKDLGMSKVDLVHSAKMVDILKNHVLEGEVLSSSLKDGDAKTTIGGGKLRISVSGGVKVNGANVKKADFKASNGVIHVVDKVLVP